MQHSLKKKSLCVFFPIANMFEKQHQTLGSKSKPRNVEMFPVSAKESIEGVKMALRVLRECQSLVINGPGWGALESFARKCVFRKLGKPFEDFAAR